MIACLLFGDAIGFGLKRVERGTIGRGGGGFFVRDRGQKNCAGLWKRCTQIDEGSTKQLTCIRGYNKLWCRDQPCPGQPWCVEGGAKSSGSQWGDRESREQQLNDRPSYERTSRFSSGIN